MEEAKQILREWNATRNRPPLGSRIISIKARSAYSRGYTDYGREDPLIIPFCDESCSIRQKMLAGLMIAEGELS